MKAPLLFIALFAPAAFAQTPNVIYQPTPQATVISPLTASVAQSNQQLLSQINNTISQRVFEHQVLTLRPAPVVTSTLPTGGYVIFHK